MKIAVLMGGNSSEWEVSLKTGYTVVNALRKIGWDVVPFPYENDILPVIPTLQTMDIVFNALHGGEGENGKIQQILEEHGLKYTGSGPEASSLAMDKGRTKLLLEENHLPTPAWFSFHTDAPRSAGIDREKLTYPVVVKPNADGSTMGISLVKKAKNLESAVEVAEEFGPEILIEEYIPGREITVAVLGDKSLPIIEIIPSHELYDYTCKYSEGMSRYGCPADIPDELAQQISITAEKIFQLMNCRHYGRVDFRLNLEGKFFCLEVNTLPGLTDTSLVPKAAQAAGISFEELIKRIIHDAFRKE